MVIEGLRKTEKESRRAFYARMTKKAGDTEVDENSLSARVARFDAIMRKYVSLRARLGDTKPVVLERR